MAKRGRPPKQKQEETAEQKSTPAPTLSYARDENGLLKNTEYTFNDDGSINWKAMIKQEYLFPNKSWFESRDREVPSSAEGLEDHQLLIKLGGIKDLARLRGFSSVGYTFQKCEQDHVAVTCGINFLPNYETAGQEIYFEDAANATLNNTSSFASKFLEAIACNRAFIRCVRNFLNVHIVGDDEIDKSNGPVVAAASSSFAPLSPNTLLENQFDDFESFKDKMRQFWADGIYKNESVKEWDSFNDIPPKEARILVKHLK